MKTLYNQVKSLLPDVKSAISDNETLIVNRREFHITQISPVNGIIMQVGVNISYAYRLFLAHIDQFASAYEGNDCNIVVCDPSLSLAGFYAWVRMGCNIDKGVVYAPKRLGAMTNTTSIMNELVEEFIGGAEAKPESRPTGERLKLFTLVIGNTKKSNQTLLAVDRFSEIQKGVLFLKDFGRVDAADEREYLDSKKVFPLVTLEGHAVAIKGLS